MFEDDNTSIPEISSNIDSPNIEETPIYINPQPESSENYELAVEDITHVDEEESLSLEKKEKEMIIKALKKNKNKRKYAALDLGISERTLYRKIKQYELEQL